MSGALPETWPAAYVGLPWRDGGRDRTGLDCWGLCILVYRELFHVTLPDLGPAYQSALDAAEVGALVAARRGALHLTETPQATDFVFMHRWRAWPPHHVGLFVSGGGGGGRQGDRVLHAQDGLGVVSEPLGRRGFPYHVEGVYRLPPDPHRHARSAA